MPGVGCCQLPAPGYFRFLEDKGMRWITLNDMASKVRLVNLAQVTPIVLEPNQCRVYLVSSEPIAISKDQFQRFQEGLDKLGTGK